MDPHVANSVSSNSKVTLYARRWFILAAVFLLNISNGMIWNSFASIAAKTVSFYSITFDDVNGLSIAFSAITVPVGFLAMWMIDDVDIRISAIAAAVLNAVGGILRVISAIPGVALDARFPVLMTGQCIAGVAQAYVMFLPTKCAQCWFPDNQRALANTIGCIANPLGILLSAIISPAMLSTTSMLNLMIVYGVVAVFTLFVTLGSFTRSKPAAPPSTSAGLQSVPFKIGFCCAIRDKMFVFLSFCFGTALALFTTMVTMLAQILCPFGYDDTYAGVVVVLMIGFGFVGSVITGIFVDKTKLFEEVLKICAGFAAILLAIFIIVADLPYTPYGLGVVVSIFGFFALGLYGVAMELAVETTFPVSEATSTGLMIILGQLLSAIFIVVFEALGEPMNDYYGMCTVDSSSSSAEHYLNGNIFVAVCGTVIFILMVPIYKCPYKRLSHDRKLKAARDTMTELTAYTNEAASIQDETAGNGISLYS